MKKINLHFSKIWLLCVYKSVSSNHVFLKEKISKLEKAYIIVDQIKLASRFYEYGLIFLELSFIVACR